MPISISSGRTAEDAYRAPRAMALDDHVEDDLWALVGRLTRDLQQLRRLGSPPDFTDETFSPDEIAALERDIEYLVADGSEVGPVLTPLLKHGLVRLRTYLEQAETTHSFVHAHIE